MIDLYHTNTTNPDVTNILPDNGSQVNQTYHSELLHSIVHAPSQAHTFNGAPAQTIGHEIFTMKLVNRTMDLPTLVLPPNDRSVAGGVAGEVTLEREGTMFQQEAMGKAGGKLCCI